MEIYNLVRWHGYTDTATGLVEALNEDEFIIPIFWDYLQEMDVVLMHALQQDKAYLIRTVTHYYTGKVKSVTFTNVVLSEAAWIPDTGRFSECLRTGNLQEVEPYPDEVIINTASIVDACLWNHKLPREAKR